MGAEWGRGRPVYKYRNAAGTCLLLGLVMNKSRAMTQFALLFSIRDPIQSGWGESSGGRGGRGRSRNSLGSVIAADKTNRDVGRDRVFGELEEKAACDAYLVGIPINDKYSPG